MIDFAWPWLFLSLPIPWLVWRFLPPAPPRTGAALRVPFYEDLASLPAGGSTARVRGKQGRWLVYLAWLLLVVAAARPQWVGEPLALPMSGRDLMLAIDISGSMERPDFDLDGQQVTRLDVVKSVASRFIASRVGDRVGLILFGTRAYLQTPLTFDRATVATMLEESQIGLAGKETAIGDAIGLAIKHLRDKEVQHRVLILLTDGANTTGAVGPRRAAALAATEGLRIYTIGIGADRMRVRSVFGTRVVNPSADLDEDTLKAIAETTDGAYFRARDTRALEDIYERLDQLEPAASDSEYFRPIQALYAWPLGAALLISAGLAGRRLSWRLWRGRRVHATAATVEEVSP